MSPPQDYMRGPDNGTHGARRRQLKGLQQSGLVLTSLSATFQRQIGSDFIWRVEQRRLGGAPGPAPPPGEPAAADAAAAAGAADAERGAPELPFHTFKRGESVLLAQTLASGDVPVTIQARRAAPARRTLLGGPLRPAQCRRCSTALFVQGKPYKYRCRGAAYTCDPRRGRAARRRRWYRRRARHDPGMPCPRVTLLRRTVQRSRGA